MLQRSPGTLYFKMSFKRPTYVLKRQGITSKIISNFEGQYLTFSFNKNHQVSTKIKVICDIASFQFFHCSLFWERIFNFIYNIFEILTLSLYEAYLQDEIKKQNNIFFQCKLTTELKKYLDVGESFPDSEPKFRNSDFNFHSFITQFKQVFVSNMPSWFVAFKLIFLQFESFCFCRCAWCLG